MTHVIDVVSITEHPVLGAFVTQMSKELAPEASFATFSSIHEFDLSRASAKVMLLGTPEDAQQSLDLLFDLHSCGRVQRSLVHSVPKFYKVSALFRDFASTCLFSSASIKELYRATHASFLDAGIGVAGNRGGGAQRQQNEHQSTVSMGLASKPLTNRQVEIMDLMTQGLSAKEAAKVLDISPETVRGHLKDIFVRLSVKNIAQAVDLYGKAKRLSEMMNGK